MTKRITPPQLQSHKGKTPLVALTCYTAPMAKLLDAHCDILLVGDSVGMVVYGMESTLGVTLPMMVAHTQAVCRGSKHAMILADLPFGTYQASPAQAFESAAPLLEAGAQAVKLEGGIEMAETVKFLVERGVPVIAHIGLKPQFVQQMGGYKIQGKTTADRNRMLKEAKALEAAGAIALLIEGTEEPTARAITKALKIPTIGIGASPACDGQVLVTDDLLGMFPDFTPRFVRQYEKLAGRIGQAVSAYAADVRSRKFPGAKEYFSGK